MHGSLVVGVLDYQSRGTGFKSRPGQKFGSRFLCHRPSYAEAKKMKLLILDTHGCPRAKLKDCSSSSILLSLDLGQALVVPELPGMVAVLHEVLPSILAGTEGRKCHPNADKTDYNFFTL